MLLKHIFPVSLLLALAWTSSAELRFEAVAAGMRNGQVCGGITTPIISQHVEWIGPYNFGTGAFAVASRDHQTVVGIANLATGFRVMRFEELVPPTVLYQNQTHRAYQITQAPNGRIFVAARQSGLELFVISAAGQLEATHAFPGGSEVIAAGHDGCTVYYASPVAPTIERINGCTGAAMATFATNIGARDIEPLPNGDVLAASETSVHHLSPNGTVIRTFALSSYGYSQGMGSAQVAASPDLRSFYIAVAHDCERGGGDEDAGLLRISLENGTEMSRHPFESLTENVNSLVVGMASVAGVPTASEWGLLLTAMLLAMAGIFRMR